MPLGETLASRRNARRNCLKRLASSTAYVIETLEPRLVLSAVTWTGAAGDNLWTTPGNWSTSQIPGATDDVMIAVAAPTITLSSGTQSINSLTSSDPINLTGGTLAAATTIQLSANLSLSGGTIQGGTVTATGGANLVATPSGGTLDGVTLNSNLDLTAYDSSAMVLDGLTLNGTATIGAGGGGYDSISFGGSQTLGGTGTVAFGNAIATGLIVSQSNTTLTIGPGITIHGGNGYFGVLYEPVIGYSGYFGGGSNTSVINQGTIDADAGAATSLYINPDGTFTNTGTIEATNGGTLYLGGTITAAGLGTFNSNGGTVDLFGMLDNTGAMLALTEAADPLTLAAGGTISGGTITESGGAELLYAGGTLDGVTFDGNLDLTAYGAGVTVLDGLTLNGTATIGGNGNGYGYSAMIFSGSQTLGGTGTVVFGNAYVEAMILSQDNTTLTIGPGITIRGGNAYNTIAYGPMIGYSMNFGGGTNTSIINQGTIDADTSGAFLFVNPNGGDFTNTGTIEATNGGTLNLEGTTAINAQGTIAGSISVGGNLVGNTTNAIGWNPQGVVMFDGSGTSSSPQQLEAMSQDEGPTVAGFQNNFVFAQLALSNSTYVMLVDQSQNSASGANAVYAESLSVPLGSTLDLNGLHLYTFVANILGTVVDNGGSITQVPVPDLQVQNLAAARSGPANNQQLNIAWNDADTGSGPATGDWSDNITVVNTTTEQTLLSTNQDYPSNNIAAGGNEAQSYSFALPNAVGALQITVTVNSLNSVFEYNSSSTASSNNSASIDMAGITFGDGVDSNIAQRSEARRVIFTFDTPVTTFNTSALSLQFHNDDGSGTSNSAQYGGTNTIGPLVNVNLGGATLVSSNGGMTWTLTFAAGGDHVDASGSLLDGVYTLTLQASDVITTGGGALASANQSTTFHRLYGDVNGDGAVNNADLTAFKKALTAAGGVYNAPLDFNNDGSINNTDLTQLKKRFLEFFTY